MPSQIGTSTFLADTVLIIRDDILTNITDPISATRDSAQKFCMTSYPKRSVTYPIVTVVDKGISDFSPAGMSSTVIYQRLSIEVRVWGRNVLERDQIAQAIHNRFRTERITFSKTQLLHDYRISSLINVDETGEQGIKSKLFTISFLQVLGE